MMDTGEVGDRYTENSLLPDQIEQDEHGRYNRFTDVRDDTALDDIRMTVDGRDELEDSPQLDDRVFRDHGQDGTNDFTFSFSEDDLVPNAPQHPNSDFHDFILPPTDYEHPSAMLYSGAQENSFEPKISIQRAVIVPDPQNHRPSSLGTYPLKSSSPPERSRSLAKTFSFARKKSRASRDKDTHKRSAKANKAQGISNSKPAADSGYGSAETKPPGIQSPAAEIDVPLPIEYTSDLLGTPGGQITKQQRRRSVRGILKLGTVPTPPLPSTSARPASPISAPQSDAYTPAPAPQSPRSKLPAIDGADMAVNPVVMPQQPPPRRDELASIFKNLDSDFTKFMARNGAQKVNVVRGCLLPFLRIYADHPSSKFVRPEDLRKRVTVLEKWWTGLLDMMLGKNGQTISGTDKPFLLDGISGLMERPEWRLAFTASPDAFPPTTSLDNVDSSNIDVSTAQISIQHIFTGKLIAQMDFVVERMSLRHAPSNLVTFCGKACAYAFLFCPGVAEVLLRLWNLQASDVKHILDASGLRKAGRLQPTAKTVAAAFPPAVRSLAFISLRNMFKIIRSTPELPSKVDAISWDSNWTAKWNGSDSDLFYVFVKHYHLLMTDFLPSGVSKAERLCAPGYVAIQAQMLSNLNSTIHRAAGQDDGFEPAVTFDDVLGPDSTASNTTSPAPPVNASRLMTENRLIMLLQDLLVERDEACPLSHRIFAEHFCDVMKASALSTSLYDHNSCFTLCDFLQQAFIVLFRFEETVDLDHEYIDWRFWLGVFRKMTDSQNTMTEIRLYAFLFALWDPITSDANRKHQMCNELLLEEQYFESAFNHWCPMVRAYYMRLVCWRIARFDGDASHQDMYVLLVYRLGGCDAVRSDSIPSVTLKHLMQRLQGTWSNFNYVVETGLKDDDISGTSTAPCNPAPGRRLLIIRTDTNIPHPLLNIESPDEVKEPPDTIAIDEPLSDARSIAQRLAAAVEGVNETRKRKSGLFGIFGNRPVGLTADYTDSPTKSDNSSTNSSGAQSRDDSRGPSPDRRNGARASMYEARPVPAGQARKASASPSKRVFMQASFKFSLEFIDRRPNNLPVDMLLHPPRLPLAAQLLLQAQPGFANASQTLRPTGAALRNSTYKGRALAEWTLVVNECQNFFERRRNEGVPSNRLVETPVLGIESFRRPG